jgi:hypothetical protein
MQKGGDGAEVKGFVMSKEGMGTDNEREGINHELPANK